MKIFTRGSRSIGAFGALSVLASAVLVSQVYAYNTVDAQLDLGDSNHAVTSLQTFLKDNPSMYPEGLVTGYYGGLTRSAVERFQSQNNLITSGHLRQQDMVALVQ